MANVNELIPHGDLNRFLCQKRGEVVNYLMWRYKLRKDAAEDAFTEGSVAVWRKFRSGELTEETLDCSLSTYLMRCCRNHATHELEKARRIDRGADVEIAGGAGDGFGSERNDKYEDWAERLGLGGDRDIPARDRLLPVVEDMVRNLPEPCNKILWGWYFEYRDLERQTEEKETKLDVLARIFGMKRTVLATTKSRCMNKLKTKINSLLNK